MRCKLLHNMPFFKPGSHSVYYKGTMPQFIGAKSVFFGIILCMLNALRFFFLSFSGCDNPAILVPQTIFSWKGKASIQIFTKSNMIIYCPLSLFGKCIVSGILFRWLTNEMLKCVVRVHSKRSNENWDQP